MALGGNTVATEVALVSGDCFETNGFSQIRRPLTGSEDVTEPGGDPACVVSARI
jgi:hypothetical protein